MVYFWLKNQHVSKYFKGRNCLWKKKTWNLRMGMSNKKIVNGRIKDYDLTIFSENCGIKECEWINFYKIYLV